MSIDHLLIHRCELKHIVPVLQSPGRYKDELQTYQTDVPCRISPGGVGTAAIGQAMSGDQEKTNATHIGYFRAGTNVFRDTRVTAVTTLDGTPFGGSSGVVYRVTGRLPPSKPHHIKVLLEELQLTPATVPVTGTREAV